MRYNLELSIFIYLYLKIGCYTSHESFLFLVHGEMVLHDFSDIRGENGGRNKGNGEGGCCEGTKG